MRPFLSFVFILVLHCFDYCQIPTASLVAHWDFSGNANDITGNGNHGTVYNATLTCDRCNNPNSAYSFNGTNAKSVVPNSSWIDMNNSQDFSLCMWIKTYQNPNIDAIPLSKNLHGNWSGYMVFTNSTNGGYCNTYGHLSFYTASGAFQDACSNDSICTGSLMPGQLEDACHMNWNFITGVYEAATSTSSLFINGVLQNDIGGIGGNLSNTCNLVLGAHMNGNIDMHFFKGALDDIRIYKKKLTPIEILALYDENCNVTTGNISTNIQNNISIYPNPARTSIYVVSDNLIQSLVIYDIAGKEILISSDTPKKEISLNIADLIRGVYIVKLKTYSGVTVSKFIKE